MKKFVLVSGSPRRKELLEESSYVFSVDHVKVSEITNKNLNVRANAEALARQKAEAYCRKHNYLKSKDILVLTADTLVAFEEKPLGKPKNFAEAKKTLALLSGKTHSVITAVCFFDSLRQDFYTYSDETFVTFKELSPPQIKDYVNSGEPMDKAGSYGIQGAAGEFVEKFEGSFTNVIGLPMELFEKVIAEYEWKLPRK